MSIVQFWWQFDSDEFVSRISRLARCGQSRFAENCVSYASELIKRTTAWEEAASNIGGWDRKSIKDDFTDPNCDSLNLALFILAMASSKKKVDPVVGLVRDLSGIPLSATCLEPKVSSLLEDWIPPSTSSSSLVFRNEKLLEWFEAGGKTSSANLLQTAIEGYDLLCISSG
ncbi:MAG: hypothetical protein AB8B55_04465 [Mariniblastus sp.]